MDTTLDYMARKASEHKLKTKQIRFPEDLAEMMNIISSISGEPIASVSDRLFRLIVEKERGAVIENLHNTIRSKKAK